MRGTAPLLVTLLGVVFLRELPHAAGVARHPAHLDRHRRHRVRAARTTIRRAAAYWALANAAIIAVYTLVDGAGARASGNALALCACGSSFLEGVVFLAWIRMRRGATAVALHAARSGARGLLGGFCSVAAYAIVLWAMTRAPVAAVAALRETSVLFAALIGALCAEGRLRLARARRRGERGRRCRRRSSSDADMRI